MLTCSKCGYENELGRIFCHSCGAKLDLSEIKAPSQGGAKLKKKGGSGSKLVGRTVGIVILAVLAVGIFLVAQVPGLRPISPTGRDLRSADQKRFDLGQLSARNQPRQISLTEGEINAFIDSLGFKKAEGKGVLVTPKNLQVELENGVVKAVFVGQLSIGGAFSKGIYLSLTGTPTIEDGQFVLQPVSGAIGSLPVPGWIIEHTGLLENYFAALFSRQTGEKEILDSLKSISVTPEQVVLNYEPTSAGH